MRFRILVLSFSFLFLSCSQFNEGEESVRGPKAPVFQSFQPISLARGESFSIPVIVSDPNRQPVSIKLAKGAPEGAKLEGNILSYTAPSDIEIKTFAVTVEASDTSKPPLVAYGGPTVSIREKAMSVTSGAVFLAEAERNFTGEEFSSKPSLASYEVDDGTIVGWIRPRVGGRRQGILSKDSAGRDAGGQFTIWVENDGDVRFFLEDTASTFELRSDPVTVSRWTHFAVTFGSAGMQLFINGSPVNGGGGTNAYTGGLAGNTERIVIGANANNSGDGVTTNLRDFFDGQIDDIAIFGRVLSDSEIATLGASR